MQIVGSLALIQFEFVSVTGVGCTVINDEINFKCKAGSSNNYTLWQYRVITAGVTAD